MYSLPSKALVLMSGCIYVHVHVHRHISSPRKVPGVDVIFIGVVNSCTLVSRCYGTAGID